MIDLLVASFLMKPFKKLQERLNMVSEGNLDQGYPGRRLQRDKGDIQCRQPDSPQVKGCGSVETGICIKCIARIENTDHIDPSPRGFPDGDGGCSEWSLQEFMVDISDEIDREGKIIDDLLSLVKMDKSSPDLNITSVSINALMEQILKRLRPIAKKRNIELVFESQREVTADVDEVKLSWL